jgi:hypothetical protein
MLLIINNLYSKPHETTGKKPANPANTLLKYAYHYHAYIAL